MLPTRFVESARVAVIGDGPRTVLALHGYPDTLQIFSRLTPGAGERLVALDFPGQGFSAPNPSVISPEQRAAWLVRMLDVLGLSKVTVLGHDMGAMSALALAALAPERVEQVVVMNSLLSSRAPTSKTIRLLRFSSAHRVLLPTFPRMVVARCCADFLPRDAPLTPEVRADFDAAFSQRSVTATTVAVCDAAEEWLAKPLPNITRPLTALWSNDGGHFSRAHAEALPGARIIDVPGGRHWLAWQSPQLVWATASPLGQ